MNQPTINVYELLLVPIGEKLRNDERFADVKNIIYDTDDPIPMSAMPAIEYYVESPWEDLARGSGAYSLQTRALTARVVFTLWIYDAESKQRMDEALFFLGGHLLDFVRDWTDLGTGVGLGTAGVIWTVRRPESDNGYVGYHSITAEYVIYSGIGK
jgi:hypothetical protein